MARYTGPKSKIARRFKDPIFGPDKALEKRSYGPGQHGPSKRRGKQSEYSIQLGEKQKAKYTYGILERQFSNMFKKASRMKGITGENLLQLCEVTIGQYGFQIRYIPYSTWCKTIGFSQTHYCEWRNCKHTFIPD